MNRERIDRARRWFRRGLRRLYPRSLLQLLMLWFAIVLLPLVAALGSAIVYVDRVTSESQLAVINASAAVRYSLTLVDNLKAMERNIRVYQVLGEDGLLEDYRSESVNFLRTAQSLLEIETDDLLREEVVALIDVAKVMISIVTVAPPGSAEATAAIEKFENMRESTRNLLERNSLLIQDRLASLQASSERARQLLLVEAFMSLPAVIVLGFLVSNMLIQPMRQLDQSVRQLGTSDLELPVRISGPKDVRLLGLRLEWLRRRLIKLERQKLFSLRHISHELKTPLASIREGAFLLADQVAGPLNAEQAEITSILQENSLQLQERIEELLSLSASRQPYTANRQQIRLDELVNRVIGEQHLTVKAKFLEIDSNLEELSLNADPMQCATIVDNLLSNAVKYSPVHGTIHIGVRREGAFAVIDVVDEGPGIDPEDRQEIFQPFYRGNHARDENVEGSGLGLSIARHYARAHGGDIEVVDDSARGAHMRCTLAMPGTTP